MNKKNEFMNYCKINYEKSEIQNKFVRLYDFAQICRMLLTIYLHVRMTLIEV